MLSRATDQAEVLFQKLESSFKAIFEGARETKISAAETDAEVSVN